MKENVIKNTYKEGKKIELKETNKEWMKERTINTRKERKKAGKGLTNGGPRDFYEEK